jgi:two-component system OmpR family sensor kinase
MTRLVEQLLALARLEQQPELSEESCSVRDALDEAQSVLQALTPGLSIESKASAHVRGNASDLARAVINLVDNARRHSSPGAQILVSTTLRGGSAVISVRDNGVGISEEHLERLGERFYRADEHRNRRDGGAGLGLSITRAIIERSGGSMKIASQVGNGTVVELHLPIFSKQEQSNKSQTSVS